MSKRLQDLQAELKEILDARIQELTDAITSTEDLTRQIVSAELEIARNQQASEGLEGESQRLAAEMDSIRKRAEQAKVSHASRVEERDMLRLELEGLEEDAQGLSGEIDGLKAKVRDAEEENNRLATEKENLEGKLHALEENIKVMRQLKREFMSSIQENMKELSGGE